MGLLQVVSALAYSTSSKQCYLYATYKEEVHKSHLSRGPAVPLKSNLDNMLMSYVLAKARLDLQKPCQTTT